MRITLVFKGGDGSGHFNHAGRPGKQGGSVPGNGDVETLTLYHGTTKTNAAHIKENGWKTSVRPREGIEPGTEKSPWRQVTYLSPSKTVATYFAKNNLRNKEPSVVSAAFTGRVLRVDGAKSVYSDVVAEAIGASHGGEGYDFDDFKNKLMAAGYDAVWFKDANARGREVIAVFNHDTLR